MPDMSDWEALEVRIGTVLRCEPNEKAAHSSYRLWIGVGNDAVIQSSAQLTDRYRASDLVGRQVAVVTGFEPLRVGGFRSDALVLGIDTGAGVVLLSPGVPVADGSAVT